jgi:hypothetical protein
LLGAFDVFFLEFGLNRVTGWSICQFFNENRSYSIDYSVSLLPIHSRYFFGRTGRIRAVEVRPQKFRANFFRFGRNSSIVQPKNLLIWGNFTQIERNSPEIFGAKLNCADWPISGEKIITVYFSAGIAPEELKILK